MCVTPLLGRLSSSMWGKRFTRMVATGRCQHHVEVWVKAGELSRDELPSDWTRGESFVAWAALHPGRRRVCISISSVCVCVCVSCAHSGISDSPHNPMDCCPPGFSACGISQASILEWIAISFSRGYSWPRDWTLCLLPLLHCRRTLYH